MQNAPLPRAKFVPLSDKAVPTETLPLEKRQKVVCAAFRGAVDVGPLRERLLSLAPECWGESFHKEHNVAIQRPFHDKLGVKKIVCIFSDTDLKQVYHFPAFDDWKHDLIPIIAAAGAHPSQVVRLLFAKLPSKVDIPPHHDNGRWVSRTHRIHVALRTHSAVVFNSGCTVDTMQRVAFNQGDIIELNNAAKHSVCNASEIDRIHLIFDFVEQDLSTRVDPIRLRPGQKCRQIRGRIEILDDDNDTSSLVQDDKARALAQEQLKMLVELAAAEEAQSILTACRHFFIEQISARKFVGAIERIFKGGRHWEKAQMICLEMFRLVDPKMEAELRTELGPGTCPGFIIIGAQKCGTTSLYDYISQHPNALRGRRREPHFFDWAWANATEYRLSLDQIQACTSVLSSYSSRPTSSSAEHMRMKYLLSLGYPSLDALRYPIVCGESTPSYLLYGSRVAQRVYALYPSIRLIVLLREPVSRAYSHYCMTADTQGTRAQMKARESVAGKSFEEVIEEDLDLLHDVTPESDARVFQAYADALPNSHGCHSYIGRGLYAFQLELWYNVFPRDQILVLDVDSMKTPAGVCTTTNKAFDFIGLSAFRVPDSERKNTRQYPPIDPVVKARLKEFYAPYNERLRKLRVNVSFL